MTRVKTHIKIQDFVTTGELIRRVYVVLFEQSRKFWKKKKVSLGKTPSSVGLIDIQPPRLIGAELGNE